MHFCFCLHLVCHLKILWHKFCSRFFSARMIFFTVCFSLFYIYNGPEFRKCWVASMTSCLSFSFVNSRQTVTRNFFNFDPNHPFSIQKIFSKNYKIHNFQERILNSNSASPKYSLYNGSHITVHHMSSTKIRTHRHPNIGVQL